MAGATKEGTDSSAQGRLKTESGTITCIVFFKARDLLFPVRGYLLNFLELPKTVSPTGVITLIHQVSL